MTKEAKKKSLIAIACDKWLGSRTQNHVSIGEIWDAGWSAGAAESNARAELFRKNIVAAVDELEEMIDGGEECRGRDCAISSVIRTLMGNSPYKSTKPTPATSEGE